MTLTAALNVLEAAKATHETGPHGFDGNPEKDILQAEQVFHEMARISTTEEEINNFKKAARYLRSYHICWYGESI